MSSLLFYSLKLITQSRNCCCQRMGLSPSSRDSIPGPEQSFLKATGFSSTACLWVRHLSYELSLDPAMHDSSKSLFSAGPAPEGCGMEGPADAGGCQVPQNRWTSGLAASMQQQPTLCMRISCFLMVNNACGLVIVLLCRGRPGWPSSSLAVTCVKAQAHIECCSLAVPGMGGSALAPQAPAQNHGHLRLRSFKSCPSNQPF